MASLGGSAVAGAPTETLDTLSPATGALPEETLEIGAHQDRDQSIRYSADFAEARLPLLPFEYRPSRRVDAGSADGAGRLVSEERREH